jgi:tetratricopeptide (TPR) repeat protein
MSANFATVWMKRSAYMTAALLLVLSSGLAVAGGGSEAQGKQGEEKTKQTVAMSEPVYKKLKEAQDLTEAKNFNGAHAILNELRSKTKLSVYEKAQIWNLTAYVYYLQERYKDAISAYENVLAQQPIPEALVQSSLKTLSQLYFIIEDYRSALTTVKKLIAVVPDPSPDIYMLLGQAHFQLKEYKEALVPIKTGIQKYRDQGKQPKENWLLLLRVIYFELKDHKNMLAVLKELINLYPKDQYLLTLAGVYSELGDTKKQLALVEALFESGHMTEPHHIVNLANLYLLHGVPYKAAALLQTEIDSRRVKDDERNLRLLSQAWYQAREDEKAIPPLERAASKSDDGELYIRLAQSYINLENWGKAAEAVRNGFEKGGLKRPDTANIMLGMSLFNQKNLDQAYTAFEKAAKDKRSRKAAEQWIAYIESERQRLEIMKQTLPVSPREHKEQPVVPQLGTDESAG